MADIDVPSGTRILWEKMRADLIALAPWFADNELLLCPTCCRPLRFEAFSLEHIIPQQAVADDPLDARQEIPKNTRSGMTLICQSPLYVKGEMVHSLGCNSWKGSYYDKFVREAITGSWRRRFTVRHHIGLASTAFLAAFREYGYAYVLTEAGALMRRQFFTPNKWLHDMPVRCRVALGGEVLNAFDETTRSYWADPFSFSIQDGMLSVAFRSKGLLLPLSRDHSTPVAKHIQYAPPRFRLRPDLNSLFD